MNAILNSWLAEVRTAQLSSTGSVTDFTVQNILSFSLSSEEAYKIDVNELNRFIEVSFREYALKLASASTELWFYSWHDEMSGTLRICAAPATRPEELPFSCCLDIRDSPTAVSESFLRSHYLDGIPHTDLETSSWQEGVADADDFILTVYVRRIPSRV